MRSKIIKCLIIIMSACAMLAFAGCSLGSCFGNDNNDNDRPNIIVNDNDDIDPNLTVTESLNLIVGDYSKVTAKYTKIDNWTLSYSTSDANLVQVDENGNVEAINEGDANIIVKYSNASKTKTYEAKCAVKITFGGMIPSFGIAEGFDFERTLNMMKNSSFTFTPVVYFNGREFNDATFEMSSSDTNVVDVDTSKKTIKSKGIGEARVTIKTLKWKGKSYADVYSMQNTINVSVSSLSSFMINKSAVRDFTLYTLKKFDGIEYKTQSEFKPEVISDGVTKDVDEVIVGDTSIATYDSEKNIIKAKGFGQTTITLKFTDSDNKEYVSSLNVEVVRPVKRIEGTVDRFVTYDGQIKTENGEWMGIDTYLKTNAGVTGTIKFVDGYQDGRALEIKGKSVIGVKSNKDNVNTDIVVGTATECYEININAYTHIISTPNDLKYFGLSDDLYDGTGYWLIDKDIDATGVTIDHSKFIVRSAESGKLPAGNQEYKLQYTFTGVLDGQGHVINNFDSTNVIMPIENAENNNSKAIYYEVLGMKGLGLLGSITGNAVIKNLALNNVYATDAPCLATEAIGIIDINNVYVSISDETTYPMGFIYEGSSGLVFKDIVISYNNTLYDMPPQVKNGVEIENIYTVAARGTPHGVLVANIYGGTASTSSDNVYVLSEYPLQWALFGGTTSNSQFSINKTYFAENQNTLPDWIKIRKVSRDEEGNIIKDENDKPILSKLQLNNEDRALSSIPNNNMLVLVDDEGEPVLTDGELTFVDFKGANGTYPTSFNMMTFSYVRQYSSIDAMAEDYENNKGTNARFNIDSFNSDYWVIKDGAPTWAMLSDELTYCVDNTVNDTKLGEKLSYKVASVGGKYQVKVLNIRGNLLEIVGYNSSNTEYIDVIEEKGETYLTLKNGVTDEDVSVEVEVSYVRNGVTETKIIEFVVTKGNHVIDEEVIFSEVEGLINYEEVKGLIPTAAEQIIEGAEEPNVLAIDAETGRITGVDPKGYSGPITLQVRYNEVEYKFTNVTIYSAIITTPEQLSMFTLQNQAGLAGYYVLGSNIDMTGIAHEHGVKKDKLGDYDGFRGTFDGMGYTISNLDVSLKQSNCETEVSGLFGKVGDGAVIKNVGFVNMKATFANYLGRIVDQTAVIQDVYFGISEDSEYVRGVFYNNGVNTVAAKLQNVIIRYDATKFLNKQDEDGVYVNKKKYMDGKPAKSVGVLVPYIGNGFGYSSNLFIISNYHITVDENVDGDSLNSIIKQRFAYNDVELLMNIYKQDGTKIKISDLQAGLKVYIKDEQGNLVEDGTIGNVNIGADPKVIRYFTDAEMTANAEANATKLAEFNTDCWNIVDGVPTWKNIPTVEPQA